MQTGFRQVLARTLRLVKYALSITPIRVFSAAEYRKWKDSLDPLQWSSMHRSPLGGWIDSAGNRDAWTAIGYVHAAESVPQNPISPGIVAEIVFGTGLLSAFETLVCGNPLAYDHIMRLESVDMLNTKISEAQALARSSHAKKTAFEILREVDNDVE